LAQADGEDVTRDPEVLDRPRQRERVRRDDADVRLDVDEGPRVEVLRVDDRVVDVREDLELVGDPDVVPVRRNAVRDDAGAYLAVVERFDHALLEGHAANPPVGLDRHRQSWALPGVPGAAGPRSPAHRRNSMARSDRIRLARILVTMGK